MKRSIIIMAAATAAAMITPNPVEASTVGINSPGHSQALTIKYQDTIPPFHGQPWADKTFTAKGFGAHTADTNGDGRTDLVMWCIEFANETAPPTTGRWIMDNRVWGQDPAGSAPAPFQPVTDRARIKASYVVGRYGRTVTGMTNDQAAAVSVLAHFYAQDRTASGTTVIPDLGNDQRLDMFTVTTGGLATQVDELARRYDTEAEAWGAAFGWNPAAVQAGITATPTGAISTMTRRNVPHITISGSRRYTPSMANPHTQGTTQDVLIAGSIQSARYGSTTVPKFGGTIGTAPNPPTGATIRIARLWTGGQDVRMNTDVSPLTELGSGLYLNAGTDKLCARGNPVLGGHRTAGNAPLRWINRLAVGDILSVTTPTGQVCKYRMTTRQVVARADTARIAAWQSTDYRTTLLTLVTCTDAGGTWTSPNYVYFVRFQLVV
jgi:LPXTG-site transpeptidase (sortase) family protein